MLLWLIGSLLQGVCTHVSDVKPQMVVAAYTDAETGFEVYQQVTGGGLHCLAASRKLLEPSEGSNMAQQYCP